MPRRCIPDQDTILLLRLDEVRGETIDYSYKHNSVLNSGTTSWPINTPSLPFSRARRFNRTFRNHILVLNDQFEIRGTHTFSCWFALSFLPKSHGEEFCLFSTPGISISILNQDGDLCVKYEVETSERRFAFLKMDSLLEKEFYHIMCSYDESSLRIFLNGQEKDDTEQSGKLVDRDRTCLQLGHLTDQVGRKDKFFPGIMADVKFTLSSGDAVLLTADWHAVYDTAQGFSIEGAETLALYSFEEQQGSTEVIDSVGNYDGTLVGDSVKSNGPLGGSGLTFLPGSKVDLGVMDQLGVSEGSRTYEFLVSTNDKLSEDDASFLFSNGDVIGDGEYCYLCVTKSGALRVCTYTSAAHFSGMTDAGVICAESVYYICLVWDMESMSFRLFVDAVEQDLKSSGTIIPSRSDSNMYLGGTEYAGGRDRFSWSGTIHAVRISSIAKTPEMISSFYNGLSS